MQLRVSIFFLANFFWLNTISYAEDAKNKIEIPSRNVGQLILDAQFSGPFKDTLIQRWVDTSASAICYLYIPVTLPAIPTQQSGNPQEATRVYGANSIGSISCIPAQLKSK